MSEQHARLSPSNHRWVYCPGSVREEAKYPDITGDAAIDGTGSHLLLELCLDTGRPVQEYLGEYIGVGHPDNGVGWKVKQDRIDRVQMTLDYVERRTEELKKEYPNHNIQLHTESRSYPGESFGRDDWWGTVDITLEVSSKKQHGELQKQDFLEVIDYKDGQGFVSEKNNPQLLAYLYGKWDKEKQIPMRMTIVQPKSKTPIRYEDINHNILLQKVKQIAEAAKKTDDSNAPLIPDDKGGKGYCRWCKHRNNCEARKKQIIGGLKMFTEEVQQQEGGGLSLFEVIDQTFKDIESMDSETLSQMLDAKAAIDDVFKRAEEEAIARLENGDSIPGYGMQPGNSKREWNIDEDELVKKLRACKLKKDQIYIAKLISPAQVMKHSDLTKRQKERIESQYVKVTPGALKLKAIGRQKNEENAVDMFGDVVKQCKTKLNKVSFI